MRTIFSIYDSKVAAYQRPFFAPNKGSAIRAILDVLKDPNHDLTKWPSDFTLFEIGLWDEHDGTITLHPTKINCGVIHEFIPMASDRVQSDRDVSQTRTAQNILKEVPSETRQ